MSTLTDPLDDAQTALINLLWYQFVKTDGRFPNFGWVDYHLAEQGLDAAQIIGGLPSVGPDGRNRYSAVWVEHIGAHPPEGTSVCLTMAGLYHLQAHTRSIITGVLDLARAAKNARRLIADHPNSTPDVSVKLSDVLGESRSSLIVPIGAVAEHEWLAMQVNRQENDWSARYTLGRAADLSTAGDYLDAIAAAYIPVATAVAAHLDPTTLPDAITNFDITCQLVLKTPMVVMPAMNRSSWFATDVASASDLSVAVGALGEVLAGLIVPGKTPSHALGRLANHLSATLPTIDTVSVGQAIDVLDAVRHIRNTAHHLKPAKELLDAHTLLGLPFPIVDPRQAWNILRAQAAQAFKTLQGAIYAAKP